MAGTSRNNNRRPQSNGRPRTSGGVRRSAPPAGGGQRRPATRRPATRRPATRRPAPRRRTPVQSASPLASPAFWLIVCIAIIVLILVFRGCGGSEDVTDTEVTMMDPTSSTSVIIGNTTPPPVSGSGQNGGEPVKPSTKPSQSKPADNKPAEPSPPEGNGEEKPDDGGYKTYVVEPGIYLIGADIYSGTVDIDATSGTGSMYITDGSLNISNVGNVEGYTSSIADAKLKAGEYLTVSGNLTLKFTYSTKYEKNTSAALTVGEWSGECSDGRYVVMSEGGDLKPGIYMIEAFEGNGCVYVPDRDRKTQVDFMIGVDGGYVDSVNYVKLKEGDTVSVEGCTVTFIEMKEGQQ